MKNTQRDLNRMLFSSHSQSTIFHCRALSANPNECKMKGKITLKMKFQQNLPENFEDLSQDARIRWSDAPDTQSNPTLRCNSCTIVIR